MTRLRAGEPEAGRAGSVGRQPFRQGTQVFREAGSAGNGMCSFPWSGKAGTVGSRLIDRQGRTDCNGRPPIGRCAGSRLVFVVGPGRCREGQSADDVPSKVNLEAPPCVPDWQSMQSAEGTWRTQGAMSAETGAIAPRISAALYHSPELAGLWRLAKQLASLMLVKTCGTKAHVPGTRPAVATKEPCIKTRTPEPRPRRTGKKQLWQTALRIFRIRF